MGVASARGGESFPLGTAPRRRRLPSRGRPDRRLQPTSRAACLVLAEVIHKCAVARDTASCSALPSTLGAQRVLDRVVDLVLQHRGAGELTNVLTAGGAPSLQ